MKENDCCEHCGNGLLQLVKGNAPYTEDHLMCEWCNSTYLIEEKT